MKHVVPALDFGRANDLAMLEADSSGDFKLLNILGCAVLSFLGGDGYEHIHSGILVDVHCPRYSRLNT
jgi:hypothetical protein